jgi:hypothetical protein
MRKKLWFCFAIIAVGSLFIAGGLPAQDPTTSAESPLEAARKKRAELELKAGVEDEILENIRKKRAELQKEIQRLKEQEVLLKKQEILAQIQAQKRSEARRKGYYSRLEVKGRVERHVIPARPFRLESTGYLVVVGEQIFGLNFNRDQAMINVAETRVNETVVVSGELVGGNVLVVKTIKAVD